MSYLSDFDYDVMLKKRIAQQAKYRKRGSKSKKCPMSTDYMTHKQWKEMNGKVMSYQLNKPAQWDEFKSFPKHIQTEYLTNLIAIYNANATSLAQMFGVKPLTVRRHIEANKLGIAFHVGKSMSAEEREIWAAFISGSAKCEEPCVQNNESASEPAVVADIADEQPSLETAPGSMSMNQFSISFTGKIDVNMIANSLLSIIGRDAVGKIEIMCTL